MEKVIHRLLILFLRRGTWFDMCNSEADEGRGEFYIAGMGSRNVGTHAVVVCGTGL